MKMKNNNYIPQPEDTAGVEIPAELMELAEQMARNVHEVWARSRMAQGWPWGPERDDAARRHPCLVPYDELPESEKEYDRATSQETLRLILKLGFGISRR